MTKIDNIKIPVRYTVGGQDMEVEIVSPDSPIGNRLGLCKISSGKVYIASNQTETSMQNTFIHELIHTILDTVGRPELSSDESLVCSVAGVVLEALRSMEFDDNDKDNKDNKEKEGEMINE